MADAVTGPKAPTHTAATPAGDGGGRGCSRPYMMVRRLQLMAVDGSEASTTSSLCAVVGEVEDGGGLISVDSLGRENEDPAEVVL